jgi:hypothetical protein
MKNNRGDKLLWQYRIQTTCGARPGIPKELSIRYGYGYGKKGEEKIFLLFSPLESHAAARGDPQEDLIVCLPTVKIPL